MKYFIIALLLIPAVIAKAQIINIPDSILKKQLIEQFDLNHDGELRTSEALAIDSLSIHPYRYNYSNDCGFIDIWPADYTGVEKFSNLQKFVCTYPNVGEYVRCVAMPVTSNRNLSFKNNTHVTYISYTGDTSFAHIDLTGCSNLETLVLSSFPNGDDATSYVRENNNFDSLDLSTCHHLKSAFISYFLQLKAFNIQGCDSLKGLLFYSCGANNLDVHGLPALEDMLVLSYNYPGFSISINAANTPRLQHIGIDWPDLSSLNVSGCPSLNSMDIIANSFSAESLDFSGVPNLQRLYLGSRYSGRLSYLNLKNGSALSQLNVSVSPPLQYICADDFEVDTLRRYFNGMGQYVNVNPYCNFGFSGRYNTIKGVARVNFENSACSSSNRPVKMMPVKISENSQYVLSLTDTAGIYKTYTGKGEFNLAPYFPYSYFIVNPADTSVVFDTANNIIAVRDFCIRPNGTHNDLEIALLPSWRRVRPGFNAVYDLVYKNRGTTTLSGNVQLNFDNSKMNFIAASENTTAQNTGQLTWGYNNLQPFETKTITVTFNLLPPPVNNINDTLVYLATITPSANDETIFDNSFILPQLVVGSIDPNGKECLEGNKIDISKIGGYLHYQIHFQNEGTDTAFNIVVADTLSDKLDWKTLELISSSHPCAVNIKNNKAEFIFENIKLPNKTINEPASNGYIAFKIKPKPSVVIGDSLNNTAAIYFDFNMPVITNRATTVVTNSSTPVPVKVEYFSVNSMNNINTLTWKAACTNGSAKFNIERSDDGIHFGCIGNITATNIRCQLPFNFTDNNPVTGKNYYRLKITDADGISFYSKTLVTGNNKAGLQITGIANNIVYFTSNKQQAIQIKVVEADGRILYQQSKTIAAGNNSVNLQIKNSAREICTLIVYSNDGEIITRRFIQ